MAKNIVICLDGTGNQVKARCNTNVVRLYELLDLEHPRRQVAYYDPGVGTLGAQGAWTPMGRTASRVAGLAVGLGLRANLGEAYLYLMRQWEPGDKIFVFGFSRGAYTARALAGLVHTAGLLRPGADNLVQYAVSVYARSRQEWTDDDWRQIGKFAEVFCQEAGGRRSVPIELLGIWDSVKAAGLLRWDVRWPYTRQLPNVRAVRHAVSIHERRRPYREYLVQGTKPGTTVDEVWFAGVHSDVGGTFEDDSRLADVALKWMADGALDAGLQLRPDAYRAACTLTGEHATGSIHANPGLWMLLSYRSRPVPAGARVHQSVRDRTDAGRNDCATVPADARWDDTEWEKPRL